MRIYQKSTNGVALERGCISFASSVNRKIQIVIQTLFRQPLLKRESLEKRDLWPVAERNRSCSANVREMGGALRGLAPRNHFLVWIVKPSGCHCTDGHLTSRAFTKD